MGVNGGSLGFDNWSHDIYYNLQDLQVAYCYFITVTNYWASYPGDNKPWQVNEWLLRWTTNGKQQEPLLVPGA